MADYLNIAGRVRTTANDGIVAETQELYDNTIGQKQNVINTKVYNVEAAIGYATCDTAAVTAAKTVSMSNYELPANGGNIKIKFTHANTAASGITLSINGTTAKPLYYSGAVVSADNSWKDGETVDVYYDGTNYMANNVRGGVVELKEEIDTDTPADDMGVTEKAIVDDIYTPFKTNIDDFEDRISTIEAEKTTVNLQIQNGNALNLVNQVVKFLTSGGSGETFTLTATSTPVKATATLSRNGTVVSRNDTPFNTWNPTVEVSNNSVAKHSIAAAFSVKNLAKSVTRYIYYVLPLYYGFVKRTASGEFNLTAEEIAGLTQYATPAYNYNGAAVTVTPPSRAEGELLYFYVMIPQLSGIDGYNKLNYVTMVSDGYSSNANAQNDIQNLRNGYVVQRTEPINAERQVSITIRLKN